MHGVFCCASSRYAIYLGARSFPAGWSFAMHVIRPMRQRFVIRSRLALIGGRVAVEAVRVYLLDRAAGRERAYRFAYELPLDEYRRRFLPAWIR
jgi:hypothetical protein